MNTVYKSNNLVAFDLVLPLLESNVSIFKKLISSRKLTEFDEIIFREKIQAIRERNPIQFEKTVEANFRKIRATRLRILGYQWKIFESRWEDS